MNGQNSMDREGEAASREEMPLGLGFSLAMNQEAMERFAGMSEMEKEQVVNRAKLVQSKAEMEQLVSDVAKDQFR